MMGTFSVVTTVSHRYYAKRSKAEIIRRIRDLERAAGVEPAQLNPNLHTGHSLASYAMRLHAMLPDA